MNKRWPWGILIGWAAVQPFNIIAQAWVGMVISGAALLSLFFVIGYLLQRKPAHRHGVPVYHESRSFWWCPTCNKVLGMDPELWKPEAMAAFSARKRHRRAEGFPD